MYIPLYCDNNIIGLKKASINSVCAFFSHCRHLCRQSFCMQILTVRRPETHKHAGSGGVSYTLIQFASKLYLLI